ncbi:MAG: glycosyl hydrolase [Chloroflexota bacterium]|nr:glycosyl hydrolase [Chloroflexota bacterium]
MQIQTELTPRKLTAKIAAFSDLAAPKILTLHNTWNADQGSPVYTVEGRYTSRSWTDWTSGFFIGLAILQFDLTGDEQFLSIGREKTIRLMAPHVSHLGVHDHGFNNVSTYGNLRRLMLAGRIPYNSYELHFYELALKLSGAVQAARYSVTNTGTGYIYSFNGPHSLFSDTIRSMRSLALAYSLGHVSMGEGEKQINLLGRALEHAETTARFNVYFGEGRDAYDIPGRVVHESIFNTNDGQYRCPSSQQGYSPFTTWTRGAAWVILGFAEQLEFLKNLEQHELESHGGWPELEANFLRVLRATADCYIDGYSCKDGMPFWDTGAPNLGQLGDYRHFNSDPYNPFEPIDSSAAAIAAQGFVRLGNYLLNRGEVEAGRRYLGAGLTIADTIFTPPYLSSSPDHQGLLLHSVYHRPNGWDHVPDGRQIPCGESSMWGDYHAMELALLIKRMAEGAYLVFWG